MGKNFLEKIVESADKEINRISDNINGKRKKSEPKKEDKKVGDNPELKKSEYDYKTEEEKKAYQEAKEKKLKAQELVDKKKDLGKKILERELNKLLDKDILKIQTKYGNLISDEAIAEVKGVIRSHKSINFISNETVQKINEQINKGISDIIDKEVNALAKQGIKSIDKVANNANTKISNVTKKIDESISKVEKITEYASMSKLEMAHEIADRLEKSLSVTNKVDKAIADINNKFAKYGIKVNVSSSIKPAIQRISKLTSESIASKVYPVIQKNMESVKKVSETIIKVKKEIAKAKAMVKEIIDKAKKVAEDFIKKQTEILRQEISKYVKLDFSGIKI